MKSKNFYALLAIVVFCLSVGCNRPSGTEQPVSTMEPQVKIVTSYGDIVITLLPDKAPKTVEQFLKNVNDGVYNDTIIHNVVQDYEILIGGVSKTKGFPDSMEIPNEASASNPNKRLTVTMLHQPELVQSDSVQFLINMRDNPELDARENGAGNSETCGYCVFGVVTEGVSVLDRINRVPVTVNGEFKFAPATDIKIYKISILQ